MPALLRSCRSKWAGKQPTRRSRFDLLDMILNNGSSQSLVDRL